MAKVERSAVEQIVEDITGVVPARPRYDKDGEIVRHGFALWDSPDGYMLQISRPLTGDEMNELRIDIGGSFDIHKESYQSNQFGAQYFLKSKL